MPLSKLPEYLKSLLDINQQPFVMVDRDYNIVAANKSYSEQYDAEPEEIVGRKCHEVSHHSDRPCIENGEDCPHQRMFASGNMEKAIHIHKRSDGSEDCVEICAHPIRGDDNEIEFMGEMLRPIERKKDLEEDGLIGESPVFLEAINKANLLASVDIPVLIYGESGVGKEGLAHHIHTRSERKEKPYVTLDCCGLSETLFESELFGHEAGAFTDAQKRKIGLFEKADGGTLFLDEVGEISPVIQAKLLRVIETGEFRRVGGTETLSSNVRIVSATNKNLQEMVDAGQFRSDLFYRIAGHVLEIPPLRERKTDVAALVCHFMRMSPNPVPPVREAIQILEDYPFPGNVRELKHIVELSSLNAMEAGQMKPEHLPANVVNWRDKLSTNVSVPLTRRSTDPTPTRDSDADRYALGMDREHVIATLQEVGGSRRRAAERLGINERKLYRLIRRYREGGIEIPDKGALDQGKFVLAISSIIYGMVESFSTTELGFAVVALI